MSALTHPSRTAGAPRVRGVLWLAFLALLLRALVPTGYMPDARALHDGRLEVTFCSAAGDLTTVKIALSSDGKSGGGHSSADTGAQCPFGLLAHVTPAPAAQTAPLALAVSRAAPFPPAHVAAPVQPAQGPPLGSRAPPLAA
ncbi:MAG: DUF2946 family protein [Achromobacter sp.]|jgi:hypothetical protein|nr:MULTISPECIES: DUF2946 family protein [Achromobacter]MBN9641892.1 DUF2946 family protein [Achromobacter sp.]CUI43938.1 Protein of uncharacterised function (DUF2946) [Achromobacter sp. 2789STDY5608633]CUI49213.1 Protein of uncharacterised function (DUF2946) [Achromobacter sp. 2789STDY5608628]